MASPHPYPTTPQQHRNGFGVTALVLSIIGVGLGLIPILGLIAIILGVLALVFGLLGFARSRKRIASNGTMSMIGAVLGAGAIVLGIWGMVIVKNAVDDVRDKINDINEQISQMPSPAPPPAT